MDHLQQQIWNIREHLTNNKVQGSDVDLCHTVDLLVDVVSELIDRFGNLEDRFNRTRS